MSPSRMPDAQSRFLAQPLVRFALAVLAGITGLLLRLGLVHLLGAELPTYITFYPFVMLAALFGGLWPGLLATFVACLLTPYFILEPRGSFAVASFADAFGLALFAFMGVFISVVAERYRRGQQRIVEYEKELAINESEKQFRTLANAIPQLCWMAKADGWIYWYNQRWYDYTGTTPEDMEGWGWQSVHDPKFLPEILERWKTSIATGEPFDMVFPLRGSDGVFRPFLTRVMPTKDAKGSVVHWFGTNTDITQQKKTEEALRESEERFRSMFEHAAVGIKQIDLDGRMLKANPALYRMLGYSEGELLGKDFRELTHPDDREREAEQIEHLLRGQHDFINIELRYLRRDETPVWVVLSSSVVRDPAGYPLYRISVVQDIDALKQTEQALAEKVRLLDLSYDAILVRNKEDRIAYWTKGAVDAYGYSREEALGRGSHELLHTEFPQPMNSILETLRREGRWEGELSHTRKDGTKITVASRWVADRDEQGNIESILETNSDITERKRSEEALRQSLERLERVLDNQAVGVMIWDLNTGVMIDANEKFLTLLGYSRSDVDERKLTWQKLTPPEYFDVSRKEVEKFLATGRVGPYEKEYFCSDGTKRWLLFAGSSLGNNQCVEFCVDIADRKKVEQALRESESRLEDRVRRRTAELEATNKELEAFSYSVSHDLRSPLRTLDGFSQAVLEDYGDRLSEQGRHYLERICAAAQRMGTLIDALLQLSRLTRAEMEIKSVDLSAIAQAVVEDLRNSDESRKVEMKIAPGLTARGDPRLLQVALQNLLSNAWKFTQLRDQAIIEVGQLNNRPRPTFFVRDNGAGFDMQYADQLFGPFQRLHSESDFTGTGIGLATVQRVIHRHHGRIWAEAAENQGATFYFELAA